MFQWQRHKVTQMVHHRSLRHTCHEQLSYDVALTVCALHEECLSDTNWFMQQRERIIMSQDTEGHEIYLLSHKSSEAFICLRKTALKT